MIQTQKTNPVARFSLKKRPVRKGRDDVNISSYDSGFLNDLFQDVAKVSDHLSDSRDCSMKRGSEQMTADPSSAGPSPVCVSPYKKRCTSLNRSMSRARCSVTNLSDMGNVQSPKAIHELFQFSTDIQQKRPLHLCLDEPMSSCDEESASDLAENTHHDSLAFQLDCVGGSDSDVASPDDAAIVAFPNLPTTVSDSSCSAGLTRPNLIMQVSSLEKQSKDSFGWFVDLDDHHHQTVEARPGLPCRVSCEDLAFQAPTAPKGDNNEAEVEWAQAADTVDDVLGDFF